MKRSHWLVIAIAVAACIYAMLWQTRRAPEIYPFADAATTSIYTLRAVKGQLSTGAYSRFHWHHPGPMLYELLAPLYALSGRREASLKWTMLLFNVAVLASLLLYLNRRSRWLCATTALAILPFIYFEQRLLFWSWNPVAPLIPLALALTLAAGVCSGDVAVLPWLVILLSFLVQSHLGLAPVSLVLLGSALLSTGLWLRTAGSGRRIRRVLVMSAMTAAMAWALPVVHDLRAQSSNLAEIARFVSTARASQSWERSADIVANELIATFDRSRELVTGELPSSTSGSVRSIAGFELIALGMVAAAFYRRRRMFEAAFSLLCLSASLAAIVVVRTLAGDLLDYLVLWIGVVGALNVAALLSAASLLPTRRRPWPMLERDATWRIAISVWLAAVVALGTSRLEWKQRADSSDHTLFYLASDLMRYCDSHHYVRPVLTFDWRVWNAASGLVLQFYKSDRAIAVDDDALFMFGEPFARSGAESAELYLMSSDHDSLPAGITDYTWITTVNGYRLIQVFRR